MKVAIVHYHLEPGGVTRVIENTLEALNSTGHDIETVVLTGRKYAGDRIPNSQLIEGLDYAAPGQAISPELLMERMKECAKSSLGGLPDLWHIHNHSLGKNPSLTKACSRLAQKGEFLLLHPHDFAEDGRADNYKALSQVYEHTYPACARIRYAALNNRDRLFLDDLFAQTNSEVHLLANPILENESSMSGEKVKTSIPENLVLYPVRAVRRKNLGTSPPFGGPSGQILRQQLRTHQPGLSSTVRQMESLCPELFPAPRLWPWSCDGLLVSRHGCIGPSDRQYERSRRFRIGLSEPWVFGKSLCGRNLPEITGDFSQHGVRLDNLYDRLELNLDLLKDSSTLASRIKGSLTKFFKDYGEELPDQAVQEAYDSIVSDNLVDFGRLDEPLQEELISAVIESYQAKESIRGQSSIDSLPPFQIEENAKAVREKFSMQAYGKKLMGIYRDLTCAPEEKVSFAKGSKLLGQFLSPSRLNLLRTS